MSASESGPPRGHSIRRLPLDMLEVCDKQPPYGNVPTSRLYCCFCPAWSTS